MKRLWMGLGILAVLLALSCTVTISMERIHSPIAENLARAADAADREDWEKAQALAEQARARWEQYWRFTATVADHTPMDELDGSFEELAVFLQARENPHFSVTARHLSTLAQAMADSQTPTWWNVL